MQCLNKNMVALLALCLTYCKSRPSEGILKYGANDEILGTRSVLLKAGPTDSIIVCGKYAKEVGKAINDWASQIGRSAILKIQTQCPNSVTNFAYVVETGDNETSDDAAAYCKTHKTVLAYATYLDYGFAGKWYSINNCNGLSNIMAFKWKVTIAHEAGHLWGMCDQYQPGNLINGVGMHETCSSAFRSRLAELSVMNAGGVLNESSDFISKDVVLMPHDAVALRLLACRSGISVNETWLKNQPDLVGKWRQDKYFRTEIERLRGVGVSFLSQCLGPGTPGVEGQYIGEHGQMIDCCLCEEQDYDDTSTFGHDKTVGSSYYTLSNIESGPFKETICYSRIGKRTESNVTKGRYKYVKSCQKIASVSDRCAGFSKIWMNVNGEDAQKYLSPNPEGNQYKLEEKKSLLFLCLFNSAVAVAAKEQAGSSYLVAAGKTPSKKVRKKASPKTPIDAESEKPPTASGTPSSTTVLNSGDIQEPVPTSAEQSDYVSLRSVSNVGDYSVELMKAKKREVSLLGGYSVENSQESGVSDITKKTSANTSALGVQLIFPIGKISFAPGLAYLTGDSTSKTDASDPTDVNEVKAKLSQSGIGIVVGIHATSLIDLGLSLSRSRAEPKSDTKVLVYDIYIVLRPTSIGF
ncbi:MAG: hypothetical protein NTV34_02770 [Proteobacteria bacterium]|nr:hypothetical protein [Pseudomonadota bacterium]